MPPPLLAKEPPSQVQQFQQAVNAMNRPTSKKRLLPILAGIAVVAIVALLLVKHQLQHSPAPVTSTNGMPVSATYDKDWALVPGGQFAFGEAGTVASLSPFLIQRHEVTNGEYAAFVKKCPVGSSCGPARLPPYFSDADYMGSHQQHPVVYVTQSDAQAYARYIGGRLPTSKEWEMAARYPDKRLYPWGDDEDHSRANIIGETSHQPIVDRYPFGIPTWAIADPMYERDSSSLGILGLAGNVAEWTSSPNEKVAGSFFVAGGSWDSWQFHDAKVYARVYASASLTSSSIGFRCVKEKK